MTRKLQNPFFFTEEMSEEEFKKYFERLGNESYTASMEIKKEIVTGDPNPQNVPILVIGALKDGCFLPEEVESNAKLYGVNPVFIEGGHLLMVDKCWKEAAEHTLKWLNSQRI